MWGLLIAICHGYSELAVLITDNYKQDAERPRKKKEKQDLLLNNWIKTRSQWRESRVCCFTDHTTIRTKIVLSRHSSTCWQNNCHRMGIYLERSKKYKQLKITRKEKQQEQDIVKRVVVIIYWFGDLILMWCNVIFVKKLFDSENKHDEWRQSWRGEQNQHSQ